MWKFLTPQNFDLIKSLPSQISRSYVNDKRLPQDVRRPPRLTRDLTLGSLFVESKQSRIRWLFTSLQIVTIFGLSWNRIIPIIKIIRKGRRSTHWAN